MYIKKDEYKNIKHILSDSSGRKFEISSNTMDNDEIYELNKFMFDKLEEERETLEIIEDVKEDIEDEIIEDVVKEQEETVEELDEKIERDLLTEINSCVTIDEVALIAEENEIAIPKNVKKLATYKEKLIEALEI